MVGAAFGDHAQRGRGFFSRETQSPVVRAIRDNAQSRAAGMTQTTERIASRCICCNSRDLQKSPAILMPFVAKRVFDWEPVEITDEWGLRDIQRGMAYPLCNSMRCGTCGVVF